MSKQLQKVLSPKRLCISNLVRLMIWSARWFLDQLNSITKVTVCINRSRVPELVRCALEPEARTMVPVGQGVGLQVPRGSRGRSKLTEVFH